MLDGLCLLFVCTVSTAVPPARVYVLAAKDDEERDEWVAAIATSIAYYSGRSAALPSRGSQASLLQQPVSKPTTPTDRAQTEVRLNPLRAAGAPDADGSECRRGRPCNTVAATDAACTVGFDAASAEPGARGSGNACTTLACCPVAIKPTATAAAEAVVAQSRRRHLLPAAISAAVTASEPAPLHLRPLRRRRPRRRQLHRGNCKRCTGYWQTGRCTCGSGTGGQSEHDCDASCGSARTTRTRRDRSKTRHATSGCRHSGTQADAQQAADARGSDDEGGRVVEELEGALFRFGK